MRVFIHEKLWAAARALAEGAAPTHARLAAVLGVGVPAVSHRASRENWSLLDFRRSGVRAGHAELMRRAGAVGGEGPDERGDVAESVGTNRAGRRSGRGVGRTQH